jgi:hypothetical protein
MWSLLPVGYFFTTVSSHNWCLPPNNNLLSLDSSQNLYHSDFKVRMYNRVICLSVWRPSCNLLSFFKFEMPIGTWVGCFLYQNSGTHLSHCYYMKPVTKVSSFSSQELFPCPLEISYSDEIGLNKYSLV